MPDSMVLLMLFSESEALAAPPAAAPIPAESERILAFEVVLTITSPVAAVTSEFSMLALTILPILLSDTAALPAAPPATAILPAKETILALGLKDESLVDLLSDARSSAASGKASKKLSSAPGAASEAFTCTSPSAVTVESLILAVTAFLTSLRVTDAWPPAKPPPAIPAARVRMMAEVPASSVTSPV